MAFSITRRVIIRCLPTFKLKRSSYKSGYLELDFKALFSLVVMSEISRVQLSLRSQLSAKFGFPAHCSVLGRLCGQSERVWAVRSGVECTGLTSAWSPVTPGTIISHLVTGWGRGSPPATHVITVRLHSGDRVEMQPCHVIRGK